jgi:hypothetical protein
VARWCEDHNRWECTKNKHGGTHCHARAVKGAATCYIHAGKSLAQVRRDVIDAYALVPGDDGHTPLEVVAAQMGLSYRRTALMADQLRSESEMSTEAVHGPLAEAERAERRLCVQVAQIASQMGLDERRADLEIALGDQLVRLLRGVVTDLGHDNADPVAREIVLRHLRALQAARAAG